MGRERLKPTSSELTFRPIDEVVLAKRRCQDAYMHKSGRALGGVAVALLLASGAQAADQRSWPRLSGDAGNPVCRQAYQLAVTAFRSSAFQLQGPFAPKPDVGSAFSVFRSEADISGGNGLASDGEAFETISLPDNGGTIFWQRSPADGARVAVVETHFGWRGDIYATYVLPTSVGRDALIQSAASEDPGQATGIKPLFGTVRWNPPLLLTDRTSRSAWIIDSGEPYEALPDWRVFTVTDGMARSPCSIAFRPKVKAAVALLPAAVQVFAASLNEALGPGKDEGTLQPTARTRNAVANAWANASVRPWAVVANAYNSREEVDAGLKRWAAGSKARAAVYRAILAQHGPAERAMAAYYTQWFDLNPREAQAAGRFVIDAMFRTYFTFHRDAGGAVKPEQAPWRAGKR